MCLGGGHSCRGCRFFVYHNARFSRLQFTLMAIVSFLRQNSLRYMYNGLMAILLLLKQKNYGKS